MVWKWCLPLALLPPFAAAGAEHRVADAKQIAAACARARPGDTLVMADGVWRDADIVFRAAGTAEAPVTLRAQTPGGVVLSGRSRLRVAGEHLEVSGLLFRDGWAQDAAVAFRGDSDTPAAHCRLTACAIVDYNPTKAAGGGGSKWVSLYGVSNRVDHCYFAGKADAGTTLVVWVGDAPNGHRIDRNHFGPRPPLGKNGGETVRIGTSEVSMNESGAIVEDNYFQGCDGEVEIISNKSCGNTYRRNVFAGCSGTLTLRHGNRCAVYGNWFLGGRRKGSGGIRIIGEDHRVWNNYLDGLEGDETRSAISMQLGVPGSPMSGYFQVKRAAVAFNTIVNCKVPFAIGVGDEDAGDAAGLLAPDDCRIANNLIACREGRTAVAILDPRSRIRWEGNLASGAAPGAALPDGIRGADLALARAPDGLARPPADSPARGAAHPGFSFAQDDIDGQPRSPDADVGCDQASDAPVRHRPPTPAEVGPGWMKRPGPCPNPQPAR